MQLTVVGCSGSVSGPSSPASSYLVQAPHRDGVFSLLLDCGPGAFGALYRHLDPSTVDAVGLSHLHADHCLDLCAFAVAATYAPTAPWSRTTPVYGPTGARDRLVRAYEPELPGADSETPLSIVADRFEFHDWATEQPIGPFRVRTARVEHPVEAYAVRVDEIGPRNGGSLVFSGDTGPCPALVELATGVDLLLVEAAFRHRDDLPTGMHLSGRQAAEVGAAAGAGTVVLTHIPPWHDAEDVLAEAMPHFDGPLELAQPGASWTIGPPVSDGG